LDHHRFCHPRLVRRDGYTLLLVGINNAINATSYDKLNFNFIRDITPVAAIGGVPAIMVVHPSFPAKTIPEFIAYAKANPGEVNMASEGIGGVGHLLGEMFKMTAGINMVHVPYRGIALGLTDVMGAQVQVIFSSTPATLPYIMSGALRALGVTTAKRSQVLPASPSRKRCWPPLTRLFSETPDVHHGVNGM
jgi:tripartite-type tricarboxylate transporter receptor subunit TctC